MTKKEYITPESNYYRVDLIHLLTTSNTDTSHNSENGPGVNGETPPPGIQPSAPAVNGGWFDEEK